MALTRVLITVKTYPTLSAKYDELVCTAGFREDGSWVRIYPVPFRQRAYSEQYKKYDWIELDLVKNERDFRPESFRPKTLDSEIKVVGHVDSDGGDWNERRELCLKTVHHNLDILISEAKDKSVRTSLAVFKPTEIIGFTAEAVDREWDSEKLERLNQLNLFEATEKGRYSPVRKLPFKFKYSFKDSAGKISNMMIEDWETGQLFWRCLVKHNGDEVKAVEDVRKKYLDDFAKTKDLHFFLGTTQAHHHVSMNPFMIIGTFHPKKRAQLSLF
jgi:hypothetical protein